jgi:hypothetical protein
LRINIPPRWDDSPDKQDVQAAIFVGFSAKESIVDSPALSVPPPPRHKSRACRLLIDRDDLCRRLKARQIHVVEPGRHWLQVELEAGRLTLGGACCRKEFTSPNYLLRVMAKKETAWQTQRVFPDCCRSPTLSLSTGPSYGNAVHCLPPFAFAGATPTTVVK